MILKRKITCTSPSQKGYSLILHAANALAFAAHAQLQRIVKMQESDVINLKRIRTIVFSAKLRATEHSRTADPCMSDFA